MKRLTPKYNLSLALKQCCIALMLLPLSLLAGSIEEHEFDTPAQEAIYGQLIKELRCLVCQNQNLADSNADLAKDLRKKTYEMVKAGKTQDQITEFMITRYGDFVLYRPPVKSTTYLLWIGPFVFLLLALIGLIRFSRRKKQTTDTPSTDELNTAKQHLKDL
ncbi:MAG: cytochrome c-type biogenesis protein [Arenicellales bacterium]